MTTRKYLRISSSSSKARKAWTFLTLSQIFSASATRLLLYLKDRMMNSQSTSVSHLNETSLLLCMALVIAFISEFILWYSRHFLHASYSDCLFQRIIARLFFLASEDQFHTTDLSRSPPSSARILEHFSRSCCMISSSGCHQGPSTHITSTQFSHPFTIGPRTTLSRKRLLLFILLACCFQDRKQAEKNSPVIIASTFPHLSCTLSISMAVS
mmetsp:Transcript_18327/g.41716  ORF Transcript_18327/g.41716 Transcript_18327/m.41716 type:complete len:212 (+) Transcript_18327:1227-1862(+)